MRRMGAVRRLGALVAAAAGALLIAEGAPRAAPAARLLYARGPGAARCPSEAAVRGAASARLGYDPFLDGARASLFVEIQRAPRAFRVVVKLIDADNRQRGSRELVVRGDDCSPAI